MTVYKKNEFQSFLDLIERGQVKHWVEIAKVLRIDQDTVTSWKKLPEARQAIITGMVDALNNMERAGKNDWRMWHTKLKMLGVSSRTEVEVKVLRDKRREILNKYGLESK